MTPPPYTLERIVARLLARMTRMVRALNTRLIEWLAHDE